MVGLSSVLEGEEGEGQGRRGRLCLERVLKEFLALLLAHYM